MDLTRESQNPEPRAQKRVQHAVGSLSGGVSDGRTLTHFYRGTVQLDHVPGLGNARMHFNRLNEASAFHVVEFCEM